MSTKMAKEPGLNNFKTLGPKPTDVKALAEQYAITESSLRDSIKQSLDEGRDTSKLERDLSTFYTSICNKFGIDIKSHDDFLEFIESLKDYQAIMDDAKEKVEADDDKNLIITAKDAEPNFGTDAGAKDKWNLSKDFEVLSKSDKNKKWFPKKDKWRDDSAPTLESKSPDAKLGVESGESQGEGERTDIIRRTEKGHSDNKEKSVNYNLYDKDKESSNASKKSKTDSYNKNSEDERSQNYDSELDDDGV